MSLLSRFYNRDCPECTKLTINAGFKSVIHVINTNFRDSQRDGGPASMTAKLATVHDRILARVEEAAAVRDGNILQHRASDKQWVGSLQFGCGYLSPYFVTDPERMEVVFEDAYVLIREKRISSKNDLIPILEQITKHGKPLLIISEDVGGEALATLVVNNWRSAASRCCQGTRLRGSAQAHFAGCCPPYRGQGHHRRPRHPAAKHTHSDIGQAKKITIDKNNTVVEGRVKYDQISF